MLIISLRAQAISRLGKNSAQLAKELKKCQRLQEIIQQTVPEVKALIPKLKTMYETADEVGAKAYALSMWRPGEVFEKFHTGPRKTEAEIEAEKKGHEKKAAKKGGEKKEGEKKEGGEKKAEGEKKVVEKKPGQVAAK